jgi:hypothetical protein
MTTARRPFRGFRFPAEVILWAVRWYLRFPVSYRDLEAMLADRGVEVDHDTCTAGSSASRPSSRSGCAAICAPAAGRGTSTRPTSGSAAVALPVPGRRRHRADDRVHAERSWDRNKWYRFRFQWSQTGAQWYKDGVLQGTLRIPSQNKSYRYVYVGSDYRKVGMVPVNVTYRDVRITSDVAGAWNAE